MPTKKYFDDQMLAVRSSRWTIPEDPEAFGFLLEEITFRKENDAKLRALKRADALEEQKEQSNDK